MKDFKPVFPSDAEMDAMRRRANLQCLILYAIGLPVLAVLLYLALD